MSPVWRREQRHQVLKIYYVKIKQKKKQNAIVGQALIMTMTMGS
jgi:hypothetical protein